MADLIDFAKNLNWDNYIDDAEIQALVKKLYDHMGNAEADSARIKLVVVGDGAVGKTCLLVTYATGDFPEDYVPTVFDNRTCDVEHAGKPLLLQLWDTAGQEDYDRLRPLSYPGSDIVLLCFSTVSEGSYDAIVEKWHPEVDHYAKGVPTLLVGTKVDMREEGIQDPHEEEFEPISAEQGKELADDIGAVGYVECSAKTRQGLKEIFATAIKIVMDKRAAEGDAPAAEKKSSKKSKKSSKKK
eukprot:TRINITY_DN18219_c0_g1_i1.p2 TRINITY_DN18219_c0_g1~~TRINITY_DN18219_c0_g1_i1.p2  ORF type:complete len:242 (+),score=78.13 TRINITY_DN18219_c0_g1_i1:169-894(+)